ncbi:histidinol-phosphate aminotransferase [Diaminobutyricimonas aerilata]|uniref:Histidinol-phosphate aminotransferase n=1 Tax=Diaminobutyricimonas aerilata TaxID=1162967 RepID=A0A2M9CKT9_9MICO|nr:histidinol-phosphate transaminase [Diaminobutyricimonas aerilata]PJJ72498.1 histidinol-phosphate aminotransferase [Diaminobutyricimonas aerilata]
MTTLDELPIRDDLRGLSPYGAPQKHVRIALNVNENTHGIPEEVVDHVLAALGSAVRGMNRYPDREFTELREHLARYLSGPEGTIHPEQVWAANGSNEILQQILQAFGGPGRSVLGFPPTYSMHSILAAGTGTRWIAAERDAAYEISVPTAVAAVEAHRPDLVFLCAPNNPTGTPLTIDVIEAVYDATDGIVVVDEAYAEFMPDDAPSALTLLPGRPRLIVSRTMSKAFAFAGARLGYLAADPVIADALRLVRLPYHLSALTQAAAIAALQCAPQMLAMVDEIRGQRDRLIRDLPALGFTPLPSWSNFVLFGGVEDPHRTFEALLAEDILIRDVGIPHHLRVTAGTEEETTAFLEALGRIRA